MTVPMRLILTDALLSTIEIKMSSQSTQLMKVSDVCKYLNFTKSTIYRLVENRKIPFYRICGRLRFKQTDLDEFLNQCRKNAIVNQ